MTTYRKWSDGKETYSYLVDQITTKIKPLTHEEQKDNYISFSPAFLVAYMGPWRCVCCFGPGRWMLRNEPV